MGISHRSVSAEDDGVREVRKRVEVKMRRECLADVEPNASVKGADGPGARQRQLCRVR